MILFISKERYKKLLEIEKNYRKMRNSKECAFQYARYQDGQVDWWKNNYNELEAEKNDEIYELKKRIIDIEFEMEDIRETAFKLQQDLLNMDMKYYE